MLSHRLAFVQGNAVLRFGRFAGRLELCLAWRGLLDSIAMLDRPKLRELEMHPVREDGRDGVVLSDPDGLFKAPVFVPRGLFPVLARFDGHKSCAEIAAELSAEFGQDLGAEQVAGVARDLAARQCLETDDVVAALGEQDRQFRSLRTRPLRHAGSAGYPANPMRCSERLDAILELGAPRGAPRGGQVVGLVAPHIDLARGEAGYAAAYAGLRDEVEDAELFVLFGTAHRGPRSSVVPTAMDFETPWGVVETDRDAVARIRSSLPRVPSLRDERMHLDEHSLEFQVLFLQHVLGERAFRIVPMLTGALPESVDEYEGIVDSIEAASADAANGKRVVFVAGADLAHEGPFFGDPSAVSDERLASLREQDEASLALLAGGDVAAFRSDVEAASNPRRICGTAPCCFVASLAARAGAAQAELLHYGQALASDRSQVVSFAAMHFCAS